MFSALRAIAVIAVIFYLSPVRQGEPSPGTIDDMAQWARREAPAISAPVEKAAQLQSLWEALPEAARNDVMDQVLGPAAPVSARKAPHPEGSSPPDLQPAPGSEARRRQP